jgi:hypothetical protein
MSRVEAAVAEGERNYDQLLHEIRLLRQERAKDTVQGGNSEGSTETTVVDTSEVSCMENILTSSRNIQSGASDYAESVQGSVRDDMSVVELSFEKKLNIETWARHSTIEGR